MMCFVERYNRDAGWGCKHVARVWARDGRIGYFGSRSVV